MCDVAHKTQCMGLTCAFRVKSSFFFFNWRIFLCFFFTKHLLPFLFPASSKSKCRTVDATDFNRMHLFGIKFTHTHPHEDTATVKHWIGCSGSKCDRSSIQWTAVTESTNCGTLSNINPRIILSVEVSLSVLPISLKEESMMKGTLGWYSGRQTCVTARDDWRSCHFLGWYSSVCNLAILPSV